MLITPLYSKKAIVGILSLWTTENILQPRSNQLTKEPSRQCRHPFLNTPYIQQSLLQSCYCDQFVLIFPPIFIRTSWNNLYSHRASRRRYTLSRSCLHTLEFSNWGRDNISWYLSYTFNIWRSKWYDSNRGCKYGVHISRKCWPPLPQALPFFQYIWYCRYLKKNGNRRGNQQCCYLHLSSTWNRWGISRILPLWKRAKEKSNIHLQLQLQQRGRLKFQSNSIDNGDNDFPCIICNDPSSRSKS